MVRAQWLRRWNASGETTTTSNKSEREYRTMTNIIYVVFVWFECMDVDAQVSRHSMWEFSPDACICALYGCCVRILLSFVGLPLCVVWCRFLVNTREVGRVMRAQTTVYSPWCSGGGCWEGTGYSVRCMNDLPLGYNFWFLQQTLRTYNGKQVVFLYIIYDIYDHWRILNSAWMCWNWLRDKNTNRTPDLTWLIIFFLNAVTAEKDATKTCEYNRLHWFMSL